jgi:hypothetical protein
VAVIGQAGCKIRPPDRTKSCSAVSFSQTPIGSNMLMLNGSGDIGSNRRVITLLLDPIISSQGPLSTSS